MPEVRLIDANAAEKILTELRIAIHDTGNVRGISGTIVESVRPCVATGVHVAQVALSDMPTIEAEPVRHGRWIEQESPYSRHFNCSECGHEVAVPCSEMIDPRDYECYLDDYCGKCGSRMDGRKHRISETNRLIPEE